MNQSFNPDSVSSKNPGFLNPKNENDFDPAAADVRTSSCDIAIFGNRSEKNYSVSNYPQQKHEHAFLEDTSINLLTNKFNPMNQVYKVSNYLARTCLLLAFFFMASWQLVAQAPIFIQDVCVCEDDDGNVTFLVTYGDWPTTGGPYEAGINYTNTGGQGLISAGPLPSDPSGTLTVAFGPVSNATTPTGTVSILSVADVSDPNNQNLLSVDPTPVPYDIEASELTVTCPDPVVMAACATQAEIDAAFADWIDGFVVNAEACGATATDLSVLDTPDACVADSIAVTFVATDLCGNEDECESSFVVIEAPAVVLDCPADTTVMACPASQTAVDAAFAAWLANFDYEGGCNASDAFVDGPPSAPAFCGGARTVIYEVESDCEDPVSCSRTFTVENAPAVIAICPENEVVMECPADQDAVDEAFADWLDEFSFLGGCATTAGFDSPTPVAPDFCGDATTVVYTIQSDCEPDVTCTRTFTVEDAPAVSLQCPPNREVAACPADQDAVDAEYASWLTLFIFSGGCNASGDFSPTAPAAPSFCGGEVELTFVVTSDCEDDVSCTRTFTVLDAPTVDLTCPASPTVEAACQDQADIDDAFAAWLATASFTGGCNGDLSNNNTGAPDACGGSVTVTFTVESDCEDDVTCTATFTVTAPDPLTYDNPANAIRESCDFPDQAAVDADFDAWVAAQTAAIETSFTGGCDPQVTTQGGNAPELCGEGDDIPLSDDVFGFEFEGTVIGITGSATWASDLRMTITSPSGETFSVGGFSNPAPNDWGFDGPASTNDGTYTDSHPNAFSMGTGIDGVWDIEFVHDWPASPSTMVWDPVTIELVGENPLDVLATFNFPNITLMPGQAMSFQFPLSGSGGGTTSGVSTTVSWIITDDCFVTDTVTATYFLIAPPEVTFNMPSDTTATSCDFMSQTEVDAAFDAWVANQTAAIDVDGGCEPELIFLGGDEAPLFCEGGSATVSWVITNQIEFPPAPAPNVNPVTPSTNDINIVNNWAHVNVVSVGLGEITLEFVQPRSFAACFEYRTDGDVSQAIGPANFNPAVMDVLYPFSCQNNSSTTLTFSADEYIEIRMVFGAETDERFDWTRFYVLAADGFCFENDTVSATFTLEPSPTVSNNCQDINVGPGLTEAEVIAAFEQWVEDNQDSFEGGCDLVFLDIALPIFNLCEGGVFPVTIVADDICRPTPLYPVALYECQATFTLVPSDLAANAMGGGVTVCLDTELPVSGNPTGGIEPYIHEWSVLPSSVGGGTFDDPAVASTTFTPDAPGVIDLRYIVEDANGCRDTSDISIFVPEDCLYEFKIQDPCVCNNDADVNATNGTFMELVVVTGPNGAVLPAGQTWTIIDVVGAYSASPLNEEFIPGPQGSELVDSVQTLSYCALPQGCLVYNPPSGNQLMAPFGSYYLAFAHVDHQGYSMTVEGPAAIGDLENTKLSVQNVCFYPVLQVTSSTVVCDTDGIIPMTGTPQQVHDPAFPPLFSGFATFTGGLPPYTYIPNPAVDDNGNGTASFDPAVAGFGSHIVSYTYFSEPAQGTSSPGCWSAIQFDIKVDATLALDAVVIDAGCENDEDGAIELIVVSSADGNPDFDPDLYTFAWSTGDSTQNISGLAAGNYQVTVTHPDACTQTASFFVNAIQGLDDPIIDLSGNGQFWIEQCLDEDLIVFSGTIIHCPIGRPDPISASDINVVVFPTGSLDVTYVLNNVGFAYFEATGNIAPGDYLVFVTYEGVTVDHLVIVEQAQDNLPPTIISCTANIAEIVEEDACSVELTLDIPVATDNCPDDDLVYTYTVINPDNSFDGPFASTEPYIFALGFSVVTWTVTDEQGNFNTCTFSVSILDDTNPIFTFCPEDMEVSMDEGQCTYTVDGGEFDATATDNCDVVFLQNNFNHTSSLANAVLPAGDTEITWLAGDASGNIVMCQFTITVVDEEDPVWVSCPQDVTFTVSLFPGVCEGGVVWSIPVATDNCGAVVTQTAGPDQGEILAVGTYEVQYTAMDAAGNTVVCNFTIEVVDTEDPLISCPGNFIEVSTDLGVCTWTAPENSLSPLVAVSNCPAVIEYEITGATVASGMDDASGEIFNLGLSTVTYTITDTASGQVDVCSFTVNVVDNEAPVITFCEANLIFNFIDPIDQFANDFGFCTANLEANFPISDNCDTEVDVTFIRTNPSGVIDVLEMELNGVDNYSFVDGLVPFAVGVTTYQIVAIDQAGNLSSCIGQVEIVDVEAPVFENCPSDIIQLENTAGLCGYLVEGNEFDFVATDNCDVVSLLNDYTGSITLANVVFAVGETTVTWTAVDNSGNSTECEFTVVVTDTEDPVFVNCPDSVTFTVSLFTDVCEGSAIWSIPVATDNCEVTVEQTAGPDQGEILKVGVYEIEYTATDGNDNSVICTFFLEVVDTQDPVIVCPGNMFVFSTDPESCDWTAPAGSLTPLLATANCEFEVTYEIQYPATGLPTGVSLAGWDFEDEDRRVVPYVPYTADEGTPSNVGTAAINFSGPVFDQWTFANARRAPSTVNWVGGTNTYFWYTEINTTNYENIRLSSEQRSSNTGPRDFRVEYSIDGGTNWIAVAGSDVVVGNNWNGALSNLPLPAAVENQPSVLLRWINTSDVSANNGTVATTGTSRIANVFITGDLSAPVISGTDDASGETFPLGTSTVTYTITETASGQTWECSFTVTVLDLIPPVIEACAEDLVVAADDDCVYTEELEWTGTASDNCRDELHFSFIVYGPDNSISGPFSEGTEFDFILGISQVQWTVTDEAGNSSLCWQSVTVVDETAPVVVCPDVELSYDNTPGLCGFLVEDGLFNASATDNCQLVSLLNDYTGSTSLNNVVLPIGTTTVTWTAIDGSGNVNSDCVLEITVVDAEFPVFVNCPTATLVVNTGGSDCEGNIIFSQPVAVDNCEVQVNHVSGPQPGDALTIGLYTVVYEAVDAAGNVTLCEFDLEVIDQLDPVAVCTDLDVFLDENGEVSITAADVDGGSSDNCTADGDLELSIDISEFTCENIGNNFVTLTVTDEEGRSSICVATVNVIDNIAPTFNCPDPLTVSGCIGIVPNLLELVTGLDDNCGSDNVVLTQNPAPGVGFGPNANDAIDVTITATDASGNSTSCTVEVTILDDEEPFFQNCPLTTVTVPNNPNQCGGFVNWAQPVAFDNCDDQLTVEQVEGPAPGTFIPVGAPVTIVYRAVDSEGNEMFCEFQVVVVDTEAPRFVTTLPLDEIVPCDAIPAPFVIIPEWHTVDNCTESANIEVVYTEEIIDIVCPHTYTIKRKWTIIDEAGNEAFHVQKVYVVDDVAPEFTVPADVTISCDESTAPSNTGMPTDLSDNCTSVDDLIVEFSDVSTQDPNMANCGHYSYTITRTWTVTDECGNSTSQVQIITVQDNNPPMAVCQNITVELDEFGMVIVSANEVNNGSTDNCAASEFLTLELDRNSFTCADIGPNNVVLSVIDPCGNVGICTAVITVVDNIAPTLSCPTDIVISLGPGECGSFVSFAPAVLEDNCPVSWTSVPESGSLFGIGITVVTITAVDAGGNSVSCEFTVEVIENSVTNFSLVCNDLVNVSLGPDCQAEINADMILEGNNHYCYDNYEIIISTEMNGPAIPGNPVITQQYVGQTLFVTIIDPISGNSCWGLINVEDKLAPVVDCPDDITVSCVAHTDTDETGVPVLLSCETFVTINFTDIVTINNKCNVERARVMRNWTITDASGNTTVCNQRITVAAFDIFAVQFPPDYDGFDRPAFNCVAVEANPGLTSVNNTGRPGIDGKEILVNEMPFCDVSIGYEDYILEACGGSYEIMRVWAVSSACLPYIPGVNPRIHYQRIMVWDMDAPIFRDMNDIIVSSRANDCFGDWIIEAPLFESDCSNINWYIAASVGFITVDPSGVAILRNIPVGVHTIQYIAYDDCGYFATKEVTLEVIDDAVPIAICDQRTRVSLGHDGFAFVHVSAWDDGSTDNCGIMDITARRKNDIFACNNSGNWEESLLFCCEDADISGIGVVEVEVRVRDFSGNENFCWVNVEVEDKLRPQLTCPADVTVNCAFDLDLDNLEVFGRIAQPQIGEDIRVLVINPVDLAVPAQIPVQTITDGFVVDNCGIASINETNVFTLNPQCGNVGTDPNPLFPFRAIQRRFVAIDQFGNSANCQQDIYIRNNTVPFSGNDIVWPRNITLMECGSSADDFAPANLGQFGVPVRDRQPSWNTISCSKPAVSYQDQVFTLVDSACFKILRTWKVIDWCNHNPNTGQGEWTYVQVIYIQDTQAPVCNNCVDQIFVDDASSDCTGFADLTIDVSDCTPTDMLVASWQIDAFRTGTFDISGSGLNASGNYPFGTHTIRWTVYDLCSNTAVFEYDFTVVDGKLPTPVCLHGVATVIMPVSGCIELEASLYDAGSFDNCTASENLIFSWSSDPANTVREFCCDELGTNVVEIWVTDEAGNQDFCITYIQIQDPSDACGEQSIAGIIVDESGEEVENVAVQLETMLSGDLRSFLTGNNGFYLFNNLELGEDYTIRPSLDENPLNGVTTYDIALIQRHILGIQHLDSPYKLIAADVRPDGVINVLDIADLRSLILGKTSGFANNTSWRFVSADQQFAPGLVQPPANIEEEKLIANLTSSVRDGDFVGVKIGDVNGSAQANSAVQSSERRTGEVIALQIEEGVYRAGEQIRVELTAANFREVVGYQFTFEFDNRRLEFVGYNSGVVELTDNNFGFHMTAEGVITTSWNSMKAESVTKEDVLFVLNFEVKSDVRATEAFRLTDRVTRTEAYRMGGEIMDMDLIFTRDGQTLASDVFALYQNQPNPFNGQTIIGFVLPSDMDASLTIFDVTGRLIHVVSGEFASGYNEIRLTESVLPASGVYYYQLEAEGYSATKRMVLTGN